MAHQMRQSTGLKTSRPAHRTAFDGRITHFIGNKPPEARAKLLVGLNMYGTLFRPLRRPITGDEYVQLLEKFKPRINWDSDSEESYWEFSDDDGKDGEVWFPTLNSIRYPLRSTIRRLKG